MTAETGAGQSLTATDDEERRRNASACAADPAIRNACTGELYASRFGKLDLQESIDLLRDKIEAVQSGDLKHAEAMLTAQADTLDAIFNDLARRATASLDRPVPSGESVRSRR